MSAAFYLIMSCGNCDEDIHLGPCITTLEHAGLPAFTFDIAAQSTFSCSRCGADNYTGDFDVETEGGRDDVDDDSEDGAA